MEERRQRERGRRLAIELVAAIAAAAVAGCSAAPFGMQDTVRSEFRSPDVRGQEFAMLAVVPADRNNRFDYDIADRAAWLLYKNGWAVGWPKTGAVMETEAGVEAACRNSEPYDFEGVVFVTWHRISLWHCATRAMAYEVDGSYAGVDRMTAALVRYLAGEPALTP